MQLHPETFTIFAAFHKLKVQKHERGIMIMPNYSNNSYGFGNRSANNRRMDNRNCGCPVNRRESAERYCGRSVMPQDVSLAMAYVPWQMWRNIYDTDKAFCRGTIFEELDMPFYGKGGCNR